MKLQMLNILRVLVLILVGGKLLETVYFDKYNNIHARVCI